MENLKVDGVEDEGYKRDKQYNQEIEKDELFFIAKRSNNSMY